MSRRAFCLLIGALALSACLPMSPTPAPSATAAPTGAPTTPAPSAMPAPTESPTAAPTETSQPSTTATTQNNATAIEPTQSSAPPGWSEFIFSQFSQLAVWFDPAIWMSNKAPGQGELDHAGIANCLITDQWATKPPAFGTTPLVLGPIQYLTAQADQNGQRVTWLKLVSGVANDPYPTQGVTPILIVAAPLAQADPCFQAAEAVLGTLHLAPQ